MGEVMDAVRADPRLAEVLGVSRPSILITGAFLRDLSKQALEAIIAANKPPSLFVSGSLIVRLSEEDPTKPLTAEPLTVAALKGLMDRTADWLREGSKGELIPARPPLDVAQDILSLPASRTGLPKLHGIRYAPVFLPDGKLLATEGYDKESGWFLRLRGLSGVRDDMPLNEAKHLLADELLVDFPFADNASKTHAIALVLQPFVRELIDGPTPEFLIDAPTRGTGKGLLADVLTIVPTGKTAPIMSLIGDEDELEKRITSFLLAGYSHILLDNVRALRSAHLEAALTSNVWAGRRLGKSEIIYLPNRATWLATGNNVELSDEMARRTIPIRLDAGVERPEDRQGFRHQLPAWAYEHRAELVSACLSIVSAWLKAGRPKSAATLGRFESWAATMGGILELAGFPEFLANRTRLQGQADRETQEWKATCAEWWKRFGAEAITAGDLFVLLKEKALLLDLWGGRTKLGAIQRIGHALSKRRDRVFGDYVIRTAGRDGETNNSSYRLEERPRNKTPETPETPADGAQTKSGSTSSLPVFSRCFAPRESQNTGSLEKQRQNTGSEIRMDTGVSVVSVVSGVLNPSPPAGGEGEPDDMPF